MPHYTEIGVHDTGAASEIIERATEVLTGIAFADATDTREPNTRMLESLADNTFARYPYCVEASDVVTRTAHSLGIVAAREMIGALHCITSLGPLDAMPADDDPILCMTWAQFNPRLDGNAARQQGLTPYFGKRRDIAALVSDKNYANYFGPDKVHYRQIIHKPMPLTPRRHMWLDATPADIVGGRHRIGELPTDPYEASRWARY